MVEKWECPSLFLQAYQSTSKVLLRCCALVVDADFCLICDSPASYDDPEILPSSSHPVCLKSADAGHLLSGLSRSIDLHTAQQLAAERFASTFDAPSIDSPATGESAVATRGKPVELGLQWTDVKGALTVHSVPPGAVVSLSGGSAEQRSGVLAAIARLRDEPILTTSVDGVAAAKISIRNWRRIVTLSSPRLPLLRQTLGENLSIGAPSDTSDEVVLNLARRFAIATDSEDLKSPVEPTHVQVPRAFAMRLCRSLLRNAPIILLDETTTVSDFPMISQFLELAQQRGVTVVASGDVVDGNGKPIGEPLSLPVEICSTTYNGESGTGVSRVDSAENTSEDLEL